MSDYETLSLDYTELDNTCPAICVCNDFIVPITSKNFAKNFIGFYEKDLKFNLNNMQCNGLKFELENEEQEILRIYYKKLFMGYATMYDLYIIFIKCYNALLNIE